MAESRGARRVGERLRRRKGTSPDLTGRIDVLTTRVVDDLFEHVAAYRALGPPFREIVEVVVGRIVTTIVTLFNEGRMARRSEVADLVEATVPGVDAGITLEDMLEVFRISQQVLWDELVRLVEDRELTDARGALELSQIGADLLSQLSSGVARAYLAGDRIWLQRQDAEVVLVEGVLGEQPRTEDAMRAARALGLPVFEDWQVAAYLPVADEPGLEQLRTFVSDRRRAGGQRGAVAILADVVLFAMVGQQQPPAPPPGVVVGIGSCLTGTPGLRRSAREARETADAARRRGVAVLDVDAAMLDRLVLGTLSPQDLADHALAALDRLEPARREMLVETVEAWLHANGNAAEAARALNLHPQSLRHRLRQLRKEVGDDALDTADGRLRLAVAVKARRLA